MEAVEVLGRISVLSFLSILLLLGLTLLIPRLWRKPIPSRFWRNFLLDCWLVIFTFITSTTGWLVLTLFNKVA